MKKVKSRFITAMDLLQEEARKEQLTLRRIFSILGEEGHAVLILFFCLPFLQPLPIPGLSTPLAALIILVALFLLLEKPPWLPKRFENLKVSSEVILKASEFVERMWEYATKIIRSRWVFLSDSWVFRIINFLVIAVNAILLGLPLPIPFSNTVPTIAIILCAIGFMEKDGVFIILAYLWCFLVASFFAGLTAGAMHFFS